MGNFNVLRNTVISPLTFTCFTPLNPNMYLPLFYCSTISFRPTLVQYCLTNEIKKNWSAILFVGPPIKPRKWKVSLSNFYTAHVDLGPTMTLRFAPNANYKRYNDMPTLVNRSHAIFTDLVKPDNTKEWSCAALNTI